MSDTAHQKRTWQQLGWDIASATLILLLPLFVFFRHNDYTLLLPEVGACCAWVGAAGVFWGLLMWLGRAPARVVVTTFLLLLLVDVQTGWLTTFGLRLLLNLVGIGAVVWFLRRQVSKVMVVLFGAMILATFLQPTGKMVRQQGEWSATENSDLPFVLHIILDEYAAPESLDRTFDSSGAVAGEVAQFFVDHDFTLFSRAYSRLFNTDESIPNILNRGLQETPGHFWSRPFYKGALLAQNDWFDRLQNLGYDLHVFQSDFITYATADSSGISTSDYTLETIHSLAAVGLPVTEKVRFIFGSYYRLSWILGASRSGYTALRSGSVGQDLHLPDWDRAGDRVSSLSTMQAVDDLTALLSNARPGQAVFAHLLLPHFPYAFQSDCTMEPMGRMWLNAFDEQLEPARNDAAGRALRYPLYLNQLRCTNRRLVDVFAALEQAGVWDNSLIILHGDHGSRLNLVEPLPEFADQMTPRDYMDAFGTLLAIKWPGGQGNVDRRQVPLDDVVDQLLLDPKGSWPPGAYTPDAELLAAPWVLLNDRQRSMERHGLPGFGGGVAADFVE